jgi:predicted O-linked N-acetylglucosamine transferase (SPINDLY family)
MDALPFPSALSPVRRVPSATAAPGERRSSPHSTTHAAQAFAATAADALGSACDLLAHDARWHLTRAQLGLAQHDDREVVRHSAAALATAGTDRMLRRAALQHLGAALTRLGDHAEAGGCFRGLLELEPTDLAAALQALRCSARSGDEAHRPQDLDRLTTLVARLHADRDTAGDTLAHQAPIDPRWLNGLIDHPLLRRQLAELACRQQLGTIARAWRHTVPRRARAEPRRRGPLRCGLLCGELDPSTVDLLDALDPERIELFIYDDRPDAARLPAAGGNRLATAAWSSAELARRIEDDALGVLLTTLPGEPWGHRLAALARRPAPILVYWLGETDTSGAPFIDYMIGDPITTPVERVTDGPERIAQLPFAGLRAGVADLVLQERAACGLPDDAFVCATLGDLAGIAPEQFDAWCRLLARQPRLALWLAEPHDETRLRLRRVAERHGVAPTRLVFGHGPQRPRADLFLDSWPGSDAGRILAGLRAGIPVLTVRGDSVAARQGASLLQALDLGELIAATPDASLDTIARLADDAAAHHALVRRIQAARPAHPFDAARGAAAFTALLDRMVARHDAGLPPAPLTLHDSGAGDTA